MFPPAQTAATPSDAGAMPTGQVTDQQAEQNDPKRRREVWLAKVNATRQQRKDYVEEWKKNVRARIGKPFDIEPDDDTINVPVDWSRTKNKTAQLFPQVPTVQMRGLRPQYRDMAPVAAAATNWVLRHDVKAHIVLEETLSDAVNASGIGICKIGVDKQTVSVQVPGIDVAAHGIAPEQVQPMMQAGQIPATTSEKTIYCKYYANRIAPQHFLWPLEFTGSDFQQAPWLGWEGWLPLADAIRQFKLPPDFKPTADEQPELLTDDKSKRKTEDPKVHFVELFYRCSVYDPSELSQDAICRLVLVDGMEDQPAIDEPFDWQQIDPQTRECIGLRTFPIKVLTLTYVSDMAIPPSDSEMGRPQVQELIESRSQMVQQRRHSKPIRWFDINMVDEDVADQLKRGVWQDMIPMNGPGNNSIGEVARASYPRENFDFVQVAERDLDEAWSFGANQNGYRSPGDVSATEANIIQSNTNVRQQYEKVRTLRFFQEIAEGIFALMQLFQTDQRYAETIGPDGQKELMPWDRTKIPGDYIFEIAPDSSAPLDAAARADKIQKMYNLVRNDPMVNAQPILREWMALNGFDPTQVVVQPQQPPPDKPNISYRFSGPDLLNPVAIVLLQKSGTSISPDDIAAAKKLIIDAAGGTLPPEPPPPPGQSPPGAPGGPPGQPPSATTSELPPHAGPPKLAEPLTKRYPDGSSAT